MCISHQNINTRVTFIISNKQARAHYSNKQFNYNTQYGILFCSAESTKYYALVHVCHVSVEDVNVQIPLLIDVLPYHNIPNSAIAR